MSCIITTATLANEGIIAKLQPLAEVCATLSCVGGIVAELQPLRGAVAKLSTIASDIVLHCEMVCDVETAPYIVVPMGTIWLTEDNDFTEVVEVLSNTDWRVE